MLAPVPRVRTSTHARDDETCFGKLEDEKRGRKKRKQKPTNYHSVAHGNPVAYPTL
jgi:hypothetical protein